MIFTFTSYPSSVDFFISSVYNVRNCTPYISKYVSFVITKFENMKEKQTIFLYLIFWIQVTQPIINNAMQTKHRVMILSHLCVKTKYQNRTCKFRTLISNIMKTRFIFFNNDEPRYMLCEISKMRMKEDTEKVEYVNVMCNVRITNFVEYFEFYMTACIYRS